MFQSSPDLGVGRYNLLTLAVSGATSVSILARLGSRALHAATGVTGMVRMFQSSPDLGVGRYHGWAHNPGCVPLMFQSSPDLVVGRYARLSWSSAR